MAIVAGRLIALGLAALVAPATPPGAEERTGAEAFAARDFSGAAVLWREEAAAGSAGAKLGLATLYDLGLGVPRDAARAMRLYIEAADAGLADAQFNVAVMLDSGVAGAESTASAAVWYARAAAGGHKRAQYNLGLLYEVGDGVPRNLDMARLWLDRAAETLPAARERLDALPLDTGADAFTAPVPSGGFFTQGPGPGAELVWTAPPSAPAGTFFVELARTDPATGQPVIVAERETELSAVVIDGLQADTAYQWRVSRIAPDLALYAAGPWQSLRGGEQAPPRGRIRFELAVTDPAAERLARDLSQSFAAAGLAVSIDKSLEGPAESGVAYAYDNDRGLARQVSTFVPVLSAEDATRGTAPAGDVAVAPGEVTIRLAGGTDAP